MSWTSGSLAGSGTILIAPGAQLSLAGSTGALSLQGETLDNAGSTTWTGAATLDLEGATWNNQDGSLFNAQGDGSVTSLTGGTFSNAGTFLKSAGTGTTGFGSGVEFDNTGSVDVSSGTLSLGGPGFSSGIMSPAAGSTLFFAGSAYTLTSDCLIAGDGAVVFSGTATDIGGGVTASAGVTIQAGATVSGSATITGPVTNAGTLVVGWAGLPGMITIIGNNTQTSTGILDMEIDGLTAGTQFDQLNISGQATLGGTLNVSVGNGFTPTPGDLFPLLTFATSTGTFSTITGLHQRSYLFSPEYDSTDFTLAAEG
jgi:hypothetical protein